MNRLFTLLAHWPLPLLHGIGALLGWLAVSYTHLTLPTKA